MPDRPLRAVILCGPGNNGGDGFVIARLLRNRGWEVDLFSLVERSALSGDARAMAALWDGAIQPSAAFDGSAPADVVIDALFGTGLSRELEAEAQRVIAAAALVPSPRPDGEGGAARTPLRVAIDIPSGIHGDTGAVMGAAFSADFTLTFHALKPGHLLLPGRQYAGEIVVADIGLGAGATPAGRAAAGGPQITRNDASALVARIGMDVAAHKYTKGHALVLAGGLEGVGAARLAARAALRVGAGLVTLGVPGPALLAHASRGPDALMLRRCEGEEGLAVLLADRRRNAVVLGPALGVGAATRQAVAQVLASGRPVVLDADALTSFAGDVASLEALTSASGKAVLTPHAGEFATLHGSASKAPRDSTSSSISKPAGFLSEAGENRMRQVLAAAVRFGAVLVLKGPDTIIAAPDGRLAINTNAPPWLATAGSGDVLSGLIGGLMAQGFSPYESACCGVFLHGEAGRIAGRGLIADDLPEAVAQVLSVG